MESKQNSFGSYLALFKTGLFGSHSGSISDLQIQLHWTMRITAALCFIGHGAWGIITKSGWLPFFASQGIEPHIAWMMQRPIDCFDITMGLLLLWKPRRIIIFWMCLWGLWTAMLRPLAGNLKAVQGDDGLWQVILDTSSMNVAKMQTWEFWERAGNWGPPFILILLAGSFAWSKRAWLDPYKEPVLNEGNVDNIFWIGRICIASLLIGHAGLGFAAHNGYLIGHWKALGFDADVAFISNVGYFELVLGILVFAFPVMPLLWFVFAWKISTEFLYLPADTVAGKGFLNIFEWIERWGDYGLPLLMLYICAWRNAKKQNA